MKLPLQLCAACTVLLSAPAFAQALSLGSYPGNIIDSRGRTSGATLDIESVEGTAVKAKLTRTSKYCPGDYSMVGKVDGKNLLLNTAGGGGISGDCRITLKLTIDGTKLEGTTGGGNLQAKFSK